MGNKEIDQDIMFQRVYKKENHIGNEVKYSLWRNIKKEMLNNKLAIIMLVLLSIIVIASILASVSPYDPNKIDIANKLLPPSLKHPFGTDDYGRDCFTRALYGGRISLMIGFSSMLVTVIVGTALGVISGYIGGKIDMIIMRLTDVFMSMPGMLLIVVLNTILKPGLGTLILVLSLFSWPSIARITRAETLSLKERDFVIASKMLGGGDILVIIKHVIPNTIGVVSVAASLAIANAILTESSLSFLGLGVQIPQSSWGSMLNGAQNYMLNAPYLAFFPGLLILITVLSFNVLGDVLRVAMDPKVEK